MIRLKNVSKKYKDGDDFTNVLNNINLTINEGEFVYLIGKSGSGKTKLLQLIAGLGSVSEGTIEISNVDISSFSDKSISYYRRDIVGFIFQDFILEENKTVIENVELPLILKGITKKKRLEIVKDKIERVGLTEKLNSKINTLSGGQKQRVSIARALVNNPKILLADEPTGNLDSKTGAEILNLLKDLNKQGYTILMVTHNEDYILPEDKVIKIKDGIIV